jgi:Zn-dependent protease with chaperone function
MYLAQALCHSAVAAAVVDSSLLAWHITEPKVKQRFRLIVIMAPIFSYPVYQALNPERGSLLFRLDALFDVNRWFSLEVFGLFTLWTAALVVMGMTMLVFLVQELIPIVIHMVEVFRADHGEEDEGGPSDEEVERAWKVLEDLPFGSVELNILDDKEMVLFSSTGRRPEVFLSTGMVEEMSPEELRAAVAHELAHIRRSRKPFLTVVYLMRVATFFNPITLIEFRKVAQEEEQVCDDIAVEITGDREALAAAIEHMRPEINELSEEKDMTFMASSVELMSHDMLLKGRVTHIRHPRQGVEPGGGWFQLAVTLAVVLVLNYYVV